MKWDVRDAGFDQPRPPCDLGAHEATFRVDEINDFVGFGVVPASKVSHTRFGAGSVGYVYFSIGGYWARSRRQKTFDVAYGTGDLVTVCLDLDAHTVTFRKNGETVGSAQKIAREEDAYYFAFTAYTGGQKVSIVEIK